MNCTLESRLFCGLWKSELSITDFNGRRLEGL
jgi:hypothetical protein